MSCESCKKSVISYKTDSRIKYPIHCGCLDTCPNKQTGMKCHERISELEQDRSDLLKRISEIDDARDTAFEIRCTVLLEVANDLRESAKVNEHARQILLAQAEYYENQAKA